MVGGPITLSGPVAPPVREGPKLEPGTATAPQWLEVGTDVLGVQRPLSSATLQRVQVGSFAMSRLK